MSGRYRQGFTSVELLITLFIAAAFLMSGYQLYGLIIKDGGETRTQAKASNVIYDYLQRYKATVADTCTPQTPLTNQSIVVDGLADATITISITCPYVGVTSVSKIIATIQYGHPQQTISNSTYGSPTTVAAITCPTGFIPVPGSVTYGTSDFCVMKYEAKQVGATNVPISEAAGSPWVNISQTDAATYSANVSGCTGCHLITEPEWMTIAQNVLGVASNWDSGTIGTGYIYSGHNDGDPANSLVANTVDTDGYYLTSNISGNQRRTLILSNGEVIWDIAGNVYDWTSGTTQSPEVKPGITGAGYAYREWTDITNLGTLAVNASPLGTGLTNASTWNSTNGIGTIASDSDDTLLKSFFRGGTWSNLENAGVLSINMNNDANATGVGIGFRVAK